MTKYYCPTTGYFYDSELNTDIPDDAQKLSDDEFARLMEGQCAGSVITCDGTKPVLQEQTCGACTGIAHDATVASADTLGHVKIGGGLQLAEDGTISIAELDDSAFVHKAGTETVTGSKTFSGSVTLRSYVIQNTAGENTGVLLKARTYSAGTTPADAATEGDSNRGFDVTDKNNVRLGTFRAGVSVAGETAAVMTAQNKFADGALSSSGDLVEAELKVGIDAEGTKFFTADDAQYAGDLVPYGGGTIGNAGAPWDEVHASYFYGSFVGELSGKATMAGRADSAATADLAADATAAERDSYGNVLREKYGATLTLTDGILLSLKSHTGSELSYVHMGTAVSGAVSRPDQIGHVALLVVSSDSATNGRIAAGTDLAASNFKFVQLQTQSSSFVGSTNPAQLYVYENAKVTPTGTWKLLTDAQFYYSGGYSTNTAIVLAVRTA